MMSLSLMSPNSDILDLTKFLTNYLDPLFRGFRLKDILTMLN